MCGRYVLATTPEDIAARFSAATGSVDIPVSHNVAPTKTMPVITLRDGDERTTELFRWGIVPTWGRNGTTPSPLINARSETVAEKSTFRKLLRTQRCLVPANGFYEWERRGSTKVPHFFSVTDEPLIAYAGLYRTPSEKDTDDRPTFTILTTAANELVGQFHDRMPVILRPEDEDLWLDPEVEEPEALEALYAAFPAKKMSEWTVSTRVNNASVDSPELIERAG
jgi:putative SOS response-associated peptidase YedK